MMKIIPVVLFGLLLAGCTRQYVCDDLGTNSVVISETSSIHKDFVFTGAVWSTREVIVKRSDGTRYTQTSDTLIEGDTIKEQNCYFKETPSSQLPKPL